MPNNKHDEEFPEIEEFEYEPFFIPDIYFLEESKSADEFHKRLSKMIYEVPKYNKEELKYLSDVVATPWKAKKGRKPLEDRDSDIRHLFYLYFEDSNKTKKRQDFIKLIAEKYRIEFDAARKAIAKALGPSGKIGEKTDDDLFPEIKDAN
jgi:hypothetical protein